LAGLLGQGSIYALRHNYISSAIEGGVPLTVIARNCGTSVRMIEKTYAKLLNEKERAFRNWNAVAAVGYLMKAASPNEKTSLSQSRTSIFLTNFIMYDRFRMFKPEAIA
jgi:hypothetical protein